MNFRKISLCIITVIFTTIAAQAQVKKYGFSLDIHVASNWVGDGFDGDKIVVAEDDIFSVPKFDQGIGFGVAVGSRTDEWYVGLDYQRTEHEVSWVGAEGDAVCSMWGVNVKRFFFPDSKLQPFIQIGWMPVMPIRVYDGAAIVSSTTISDAIYVGSIANFSAGAGVEYIIKPNISIRATLIYKMARYPSVKSSEEKVSFKIDKEINADDINMTAGMIFVF